MDFDSLSRYRFFLSAFSIALFLLFVAVALLSPSDFVRRELVDHGLWLLFVLSFIAGFLDVRLYWRSLPILSTYIISLTGLVLLVVGRFGSMIYSLLALSFSIQPVGGCLIDPTSIHISLITPCGAYLVFVATAWHVFRGPLVFKSSPTLSEVAGIVVGKLTTVPNIILYTVSFLIGFLVRVYPETKYSLPIGWDTLEYIANALDFAHSPQIPTTYTWLGSYRNLPPLLTWISGLFTMISDPFLFFKFYPPIIFGSITLTVYAISYSVSKSKLVGILAVLATAFNPWILGQTQQWQRHVLGLLLLLLYLYLDQVKKNLASRITTLILLSISYEPGAVIALMISAFELLWAKTKKFALPAVVSLAMLLYYIGFPTKHLASITPTGVYVAGGLRYGMHDALRYTIVCSLLLSPSIVVCRIWKDVGRGAKVSIAILLAIFLSPMISTIGAVVQYRWFLMLLTVLTPYTVVALTGINKKLSLVATLLLVLIGSAYPFTPYGYSHFNIWLCTSPYARGYPWSLTPAITNISEVELVAKLIEANKSTPILVQLGLFPALHIFIRNPTNVIILQQVSLFPAVNTMKNLKIQEAIVITPINITRELEQLSKAKENQIIVEKLKEDNLNVYVIKLKDLG